MRYVEEAELPRPSSDRKDKIAGIAAEVTYAQGFRQTTLADIAKAAKVPLGSVYYYFKTKEDVGHAVVGALSERYKQLQQGWDTAGVPKKRLAAFVDMTIDNADTLQRFGCPIGSLGSELGKEDGALAEELSQIFRETLRWMEAQFVALGCDAAAASAHALHILSALEGATLIGHMFAARDPIDQEAQRLKAWIDTFDASSAASKENESA